MCVVAVRIELVGAGVRLSCVWVVGGCRVRYCLVSAIAPGGITLLGLDRTTRTGINRFFHASKLIDPSPTHPFHRHRPQSMFRKRRPRPADGSSDSDDKPAAGAAAAAGAEGQPLQPHRKQRQYRRRTSEEEGTEQEGLDGYVAMWVIEWAPESVGGS